MARKALGKKLRFEVFKRDGFRCKYCGATPMQTALVVDHVVPVAAGGTNEPDNLLTACEPCNQGKGAVPLDRTALATQAVTDTQREQAEQIREYLQIHKEVTEAKGEVYKELLQEWGRWFKQMDSSLPGRLPKMVEQVGFDGVLEAISITGRKAQRLASDGVLDWTPVDALRYLSGVLRNLRRERR